MLRSPRIRLQALYYLSLRLPVNPKELIEYLPQKNLMINSLIAAMNSNNQDVQKATIEILIKHFPIDVSGEIFSDHERVIIVENAFKLLKCTHEKLVWN